MPLNLTLLTPTHLIHAHLPIERKGKHYLETRDREGQATRIASIEAKEDTWKISPYAKNTLHAKDPETNEAIQIKECSLESGIYEIRTEEDELLTLLAEKEDIHTKIFTKLGFSTDITLTIGKSKDNIFSFAGDGISAHHATLTLTDETFTVTDTASKTGVFLNGRRIEKNTPNKLIFGDNLFIGGVTFFIGRRFVGYNNPSRKLTIQKTDNQVIYTPQLYTREEGDMPCAEKKKEPFFRSVRIMREICPLTLSLEDPPQKQKPEDTPAILKIGPSLGMALASVMMGLYMVSNILGGEGNSLRALPMLGMMVAMVLGAVLWPNLSRRYEKRKAAREESKRRGAYGAYLDSVRRILIKESALQKEILLENRISLDECLRRAETKDARLYERTPTHTDFLELRIGTGDIPLDAHLTFPEERLTLDEDILKNLLTELKREKRLLCDVPLTVSLTKDFILGVTGTKEDTYPFIRGLIAEMCALHAPDEVKLVFIGDSEYEKEWECVRALPHIF